MSQQRNSLWFLRILAMPSHHTEAPVILGWEAEFLMSAAGSNVVMSGSLFGSKGGSIEYMVDEHEAGDSTNGRYKAQKNGRLQLLITLNFYEKHNVSSITLFDVDEIALAIYPNGTSAPSGETQKTPWVIPSFIIGPMKLDWDQDGKMNGSMSGKSNGVFTTPSN